MISQLPLNMHKKAYKTLGVDYCLHYNYLT